MSSRRCAGPTSPAPTTTRWSRNDSAHCSSASGKNVARHFSEKNGAAIAKGYGTAAVPDYANLSRKDTLKAIAAFATTATGTAADKTAAATLLDGLKNLDPNSAPDSMLAD